ncbi:hypothetical protein EYF80_011612 [Liparis tanakae]|uniref:Uncharacterized protein n=1 Tax=Liparis tanakae TaxID=230148 RepID=A0A4Z2IJY8_9TELE|nr:hypothetical protein EYF80_011612 [Liparis tanakae]
MLDGGQLHWQLGKRDGGGRERKKGEGGGGKEREAKIQELKLAEARLHFVIGRGGALSLLYVGQPFSAAVNLAFSVSASDYKQRDLCRLADEDNGKTNSLYQ